MMNKILLCAWSLDFDLGGTESYMMRMAQWAYENDILCYFVFQNGKKIEDSWSSSLLKYNVRVEWFECKSAFHSLSISESLGNILRKENVTLLATDIGSYNRFVAYKEINELKNLNVLYYILHPAVSKMTHHRIVNYPYRKMLSNEFDKSIIFMDEECINACRTFYKKNYIIDNIYRIGFKIEPVPPNIFESRVEGKKDIFEILSVSRMVFPFKGYQMGLVNIFENILETNKNIRLTIIGDGKDADVLDSEIERLPESVKVKIRRVSSVPYEEIEEYMKKAHLYIGMGTTLLDAARVGLPSVIAMHDQMGTLSPGLFNDNYNNLGGVLELEKQSSNIEEQINKVCNMSDGVYRQLCIDTYEIYKKEYDINDIMKRILEKRTPTIKMGFGLMVYDYFLQKHQNRL